MIRKVAVRGIIVSDDKLLCAKLKAYNGQPPTDYWSILGGGVEIGEPLILALDREIFEETGIHPKVGNLLYMQQFPDKHDEKLEFFFHVTNSDDFLNIDLSKSSHGQNEIAEISLIDPRTENVLPKFLQMEPLDNLASQPVKIFNYL